MPDKPSQPFTDEELRDLARLARSLSELRKTDAAQKTTSSAAAGALQESERFAKLAAKCESLRPPRRSGVARLRTRHEHLCNRTGPAVEVAMEVETCSFCGVPQAGYRERNLDPCHEG